MTIFISLSVLALFVFLFRVWKRAAWERKKKRARDRIENVYLVSCHPKTNQPPSIGPMEEFVQFVPYAKMSEVKMEWERLLEESGNKFWGSEDLDKRLGLKIKMIFFRHGEFVNEDFDSEFGERAAAEIRLDRATRHKELSRYGGWYLKEWHGQNCVEWEKGISSK